MQNKVTFIGGSENGFSQIDGYGQIPIVHSIPQNPLSPAELYHRHEISDGEKKKILYVLRDLPRDQWIEKLHEARDSLSDDSKKLQLSELAAFLKQSKCLDSKGL
jgi:hypothetical protein